VSAAPSVAPLGLSTHGGRFVALEPIEERHHANPKRAASDAELFKHIPPVGDASRFEDRIGHLRAATERGQRIAYAVRALPDGIIVGSTS